MTYKNETTKLIKEINPHYNPSDPYQTHAEFLISILKSNTNTKKNLIELGCGYGSTPIMRYFLEDKKFNFLSSYDSNLVWVENMKNEFKETDNHKYNLVYDWKKTIDMLEKDLKDEECFLVFVDMSPWEARKYAIDKLIDKTDYIILHDSDYFPNNNIFGKVLTKIFNEKNTGLRDYSDLSCNYKEYFPKNFAAPTGPPSLFLSKKYSCSGYFFNNQENK